MECVKLCMNYYSFVKLLTYFPELHILKAKNSEVAMYAFVKEHFNAIIIACAVVLASLIFAYLPRYQYFTGSYTLKIDKFTGTFYYFNGSKWVKP